LKVFYETIEKIYKKQQKLIYVFSKNKIKLKRNVKR
jgi:hypothetical protein